VQYTALFGRVRCGGVSFCYTVGNTWAGPGSRRRTIVEVHAGTLRSGWRVEAEESRLTGKNDDANYSRGSGNDGAVGPAGSLCRRATREYGRWGRS